MVKVRRTPKVTQRSLAHAFTTSNTLAGNHDAKTACRYLQRSPSRCVARCTPGDPARLRCASRLLAPPILRHLVENFKFAASGIESRALHAEMASGRLAVAAPPTHRQSWIKTSARSPGTPRWSANCTAAPHPEHGLVLKIDRFAKSLLRRMRTNLHIHIV